MTPRRCRCCGGEFLPGRWDEQNICPKCNRELLEDITEFYCTRYQPPPVASTPETARHAYEKFKSRQEKE